MSSTRSSRALTASLLFFGMAIRVTAWAADTHCTSEETTYFNCKVSGSKKIASVCGAGYDFDRRSAGYLQYRFGRVGSAELVFPASTAPSEMMDKFNFLAARTADLKVWGYDLYFMNGAYTYKIGHSEERDSRNRSTFTSSIMVWETKNRGRLVNLRCTNGKAGESLNLNHVIPLMSTPGRQWYEPLW